MRGSDDFLNEAVVLCEAHEVIHLVVNGGWPEADPCDGPEISWQLKPA
jgi:hypothetical protein